MGVGRLGCSKIAIALTAVVLTAASPAKLDPDTAAWWATTAQLSNDAMEGRDTGSAAYERAARLVAAKFAAAGLKPAGENGGWFQRVPMHEVAVLRAQFSVGGRPLVFLHDLTVSPSEAMPQRIDAPLAYGGYCAPSALRDVRGRIVICHGTHRQGLPGAAEREAAVRAAGAIGMMTIADPGFTVEPPRWPYAYARTVTLAGAKVTADPFVKFTLNAQSLGKLIGGTRRNAAALIADGSAGRPLPSFAIPGRLHAQVHSAPARHRIAQRARHAARLGPEARRPGDRPVRAPRRLWLRRAGQGRPAVQRHARRRGLCRPADPPRRTAARPPLPPSDLFAAWTGEEKGLLGSRWFIAHPTVPLSRIAADINLDQLRPIFPLKLLTVHALDDTSLGDDARIVAASLGIAVQKDPEPERNLLQRSDQWPFLQAGIPATAFVFGYRPGSPSEQVYRQWYRTGYHKPQDDLKQPMDWKAAADFNRFFYELVERVADQPAAPIWKPGSVLRPSR